MGINAIGSGVDYSQYVLDLETLQMAKKGASGELEEVTPAEKERVLSQAGLQIGGQGQLIDVFSGDTFEMKDASRLQSQFSVGGKPIFTDSSNSAGDASRSSDVRAACDLMQNLNGSSSALMLQQLLVLLRLTQQDDVTNHEMLSVADNMKLLSKDNEISAKQAQVDAESSQATTELIAACGAATAKITAATTKIVANKMGKNDEGADNKTQERIKNFARYFDPAAKNTSGLWTSYANMISYMGGAKAEGQKASMLEQDASKNTEVINQLQNAIKEGQRGVVSTHEKALQLLENVAEREVQNIKSMTTA